MLHHSSRVTCTCQTCATTFLILPSEARKGRGRFCSRACYDTSRANPPVTQTCPVCGRSFSVYPSVLATGNGKHCSPHCYHASQTIPLIDRFFRYVGKKTPAGCILWTGTTNWGGYGVIGRGGRGR